MMKTVLMIDGRRDVYSAEDILDSTIKVGDLISFLEQYDEDTPVMINNDNGYTYGKITTYSIDEEDVEIDNEEYDEDEED